MAKVSKATQVVQRAQAQYPKNLAAVQAYFGPIPYGQQKVDARTADKHIAQMTPDQMQQLAQTDPVAAETAAHRLAQLDAKAAATPPLPGQDTFEP